MFWILFLLICLLSVLTSIWSKGIFTIQIFLLPLLILIGVEVKNSFKWYKKLNIVWLVGVVVIMTLRLVTVLNWNISQTEFEFWLPSQDMAFYGELAEKLLYMPHESVFFDQQINQLGTTPYHYFEFWISAFFAEIFSTSGYVANSICTLPLLEITFFTGLLTLYAQHKNSFSPFWVILGLFLTGIYFPFYDQLKLSATFWLTNSIFTGLSEHYFWWIAIAIAYQQHKFRLCVYLIYCLPFVSPTLWAACWTGLLVVLVAEKMSFLQTTIFHKKEILLFIVLPLCYIVFYITTKSTQSVASQDVSFLAIVENPYLLIQSLKSLILYLTAIIVIYLPFVGFIGFFNKKKSYILVLLFCTGAMLGAISLYLLFPLHKENFQFIRNFALPFFQITILYFIIENYNYLKNKVKILLLILLLYGFVFTLYWFWKELLPNQVYEREYVSQIFKELSKDSFPKKGITMHGKNAYEITPIFNYNGNFRQPATYLTFRRDITDVYNLDMACLALQHQTHTSLLEADIFYQWLQKKQVHKCAVECVWQFIEEKKLYFLILGEEIEVPQEKRYLIDTVFVDRASKEKFFVLKK